MENAWDDAMRQQEEQKRMDDVRRVEAVMQMARQNQQNSWDEFGGVMKNVRSQRQQLQLAKQNDTASMMRCAMENGGAVPNEIVDLFNRKYFTPEQVQSGYGVQPGSGFMRDGSFNIRMGMGIDQNTNQPAVQDVSIGLPQQFVMMNRNNSVFDDGARQALSKKLLSLGYSGRELDNWATMGGGPEMAIYTPEGQKNAMSLGIQRARAANPDAISTRMGGGAGGREIGGTAPFKGFGPRDNHSRISFFGTGGAGTGYTTREYNGHTGEDTGFVNHEQRREEELNREADRQERINKARQRAGIGRTFEEQMALEDRRIAAREAMAEAERERREGELKDRQIKFIQSEVAKMRGSKRKNVAGAEEPAYTDEQIADRETELYGIFGLEKPQGKKGQEPNPQGESPRGGQAASSKVDNSGNEKWGSLTPAQIEKVKAKGGTYDEKTGEIVLPNGKRMKV